MKKILLAFGTCPEAIKMIPLVKEFKKKGDSIRYNCVRYRVECVTGADLFLSRDLVEKVGGLFDSVIFMYSEESEL
ncbi:hypothetical protein [Bacteroides oleiciplenus]|uniref:Uncharacterized protein n=1 Tax=Bacteroides oleiciplenus TaxID=626931 RepID=A0A3E5B8N8_9BACE|nr:hypothetical protein [Bacteroides oleiciplenus]RGN33941.1 hypothetical protein DXB65_15830 [Bacteroides oleiciplenus]